MLQVENMKSTRTGESVANQFFITVDSSVYNQFSGDLSPFLLQYLFENACKMYLNMLL